MDIIRQRNRTNGTNQGTKAYIRAYEHAPTSPIRCIAKVFLKCHSIVIGTELTS